MLRKFGYAATLSVMALATPLFADGGSEALETQVVAITGEGYFPHTTYTASGAIVRHRGCRRRPDAGVAGQLPY